MCSRAWAVMFLTPLGLIYLCVSFLNQRIRNVTKFYEKHQDDKPKREDEADVKKWCFTEAAHEQLASVSKWKWGQVLPKVTLSANPSNEPCDLNDNSA